MSITATWTSVGSVRIPLIHTCTTTRTNSHTPVSISSISNASGKLQINTYPASHYIEDKDIIKIEGINGLPQNLSRATVTGTQSLVCTDIAYSSSYSLISPRTVTRYNQGVHIRAVVTAFGKQVVLVSTVSPYTFDVAPFLRTGLIEQAKPAPTLNTITSAGGNMAYTYSVQLQEWGLNAAGVPEAFISAGSTVNNSSLQAYMAYPLIDYLVSTTSNGKVLNCLPIMKAGRSTTLLVSYAFDSAAGVPGIFLKRIQGPAINDINYTGTAGDKVLTLGVQIGNDDKLLVRPTLGGVPKGVEYEIYPSDISGHVVRWRSRNGAVETLEVLATDEEVSVSTTQWRKENSIGDMVGERVNTMTFEITDGRIADALVDGWGFEVDDKPASLVERRLITNSRGVEIQRIKLQWKL